LGPSPDQREAQLPRPRAIIVVSAHYPAAVAAAGGAAAPETVHDFHGFPAALYELRYPAPGEPALAQDVVARWRNAGLPARLDGLRGLDHGVWVVLRRMYPDADIPVVPVAVDPRSDAEHHLELGRALEPLREDGVLVIGSGGFVHNLGELDWHDDESPLAPWALEFRDWMDAALLAGDRAALLDWKSRAPHAQRAHPTVEHLMPLFVALGAAGKTAPPRRLHRSHRYGSLALDAYAFGS
jgi:4,5-DOPA dioxygenase extradiol